MAAYYNEPAVAFYNEPAVAFYNEIDPFKAEVLRAAIEAGAIAPGDVDERSIRDVRGDELRGYTQCHFFAGGGFWSLALRQAGWPDDRAVWTGSCPCPSFSAAGKGAGFRDPRHLWPHWARLIRECKPSAIFGEQVSSAIGHGWLDLVQTDLEAQDYAVGKAVFGAASVGAPHIRQRLYFVADSECCRSQCEQIGQPTSVLAAVDGEAGTRITIGACSAVADRVADSEHSGYGRQVRLEAVEDCDQQKERVSNGDCAAECVADTDGGHAKTEWEQRSGEQRQQPQDGGAGLMADTKCYGGRSDEPGRRSNRGTADGRNCDALRPHALNGFWRDADWLGCRDEKWRPVESGTQPLAHGSTARVGRLRMYGDAIVVPAAQAFIEAYLKTGNRD